MNNQEFLQNDFSRDCPARTPASKENHFANSIIFFGNGLLADYTKDVLAKSFNIIFHARSKEDLEEVKKLKKAHPEAHGVLASFGVIIKKDILDLFEPEGILNIHPSLLPEYRGASPIESAILDGKTTLGLSVMKLAPAMDAGPIYYQNTLDFAELLDPHQIADAATIKATIYQKLAELGANWIVQNLHQLPTPVEQSGEASFCGKFDKSLSELHPNAKTAAELHREIIAFSLYPRSKMPLGGHETLILASHIPNPSESPVLSISAKDGQILSLDRVQPAGKRPMDAKSFKNGYLK